MYAFLLCLSSLFSMSCQQTDSRITRHLVPLSTPLEKTEHLHLDYSNGTKNVTGCSECCTNFSCMYNLIVNGLRASEEFEALGNLLYLSGDEKPVFIPINVRLTWNECFQNTSEIKPQSSNYSYVWGENATYATFGLAQELFQTIILFDPFITAVAILEQGFIPKVAAVEDRLEDWVSEHNQTLTVNISELMCVSESHTLNLTLNTTFKFVMEEALTKVCINDVPYQEVR